MLSNIKNERMLRKTGTKKEGMLKNKRKMLKEEY